MLTVLSIMLGAVADLMNILALEEIRRPRMNHFLQKGFYED